MKKEVIFNVGKIIAKKTFQFAFLFLQEWFQNEPKTKKLPRYVWSQTANTMVVRGSTPDTQDHIIRQTYLKK